MAAQGVRAAALRRGQGEDRGAGRLGQADGDAQEAARGAEGAPRGRHEVDRHRRHEPVRRLRLQPRGHPHRAGRQRQPQRGQGLGRAHVPQPRRRRRAQHAQHQGRAAPAAPLRARGRPRRARHGRHDRRHGEERRLPRPPSRAGAAQPREGAAVPRRGRLDGPARARLRGALLGDEDRVPPSRVLLLPQLRLRPRLARQRATEERARRRRGTSCTSTGPTGR